MIHIIIVIIISFIIIVIIILLDPRVKPRTPLGVARPRRPLGRGRFPFLGRGDDVVGNPHRAQISRFELFELILLLAVGKQFPVKQFEATVLSQSTVSPPLIPRSRTLEGLDFGLASCL